MPLQTVESSLRPHTVLFGALADRTRLALLSNLASRGEMSIAALSTGRSISRQAVTKHLRVLARAGLVRAVRHGREQRFTLVPASLHHAAKSLDLVSQQWTHALGRLKSSLESEPHEPGQ